jgi:hypothetical protein
MFYKEIYHTIVRRKKLQEDEDDSLETSPPSLDTAKRVVIPDATQESSKKCCLS